MHLGATGNQFRILKKPHTLCLVGFLSPERYSAAYLLTQGLILNSAEQTRSVSRSSARFLNLKNAKVKGIFKSCILLAYQWYLVSSGFSKNNANKSDFRKRLTVTSIERPFLGGGKKGCNNIESSSMFSSPLQSKYL